MEYMKKHLLTFLIVAVVVTTAYAAATKLTSLWLTSTLRVDGASTLTGRTTFGAPTTPYPRTLAQINALTSDTTGQIVWVTDGVMAGLCQSTGSVNAGSWVVLQATAPASTGAVRLHCQ